MVFNLNIFIITREESFYVPLYLEQLLKRHHQKIIGAYVAKEDSPFLSKYQLAKISNLCRLIKYSSLYILYKIIYSTDGGRVHHLLKKHRFVEFSKFLFFY